MSTTFEVLYDLAIEIQTNSELKNLTFHHNANRETVEVGLRESITQLVMPDEDVHTQWGIVRIFCRNYVNRAQAPVTDLEIKNLLLSIECAQVNDDARIQYLPKAAASLLKSKRIDELVTALTMLSSKDRFESLNNQSYLQWINSRWTHWTNQSIEILDVNELLKDLNVLYKDKYTKIPGMGLPLAANFFADIGLKTYAKPDLHVTPIVNMLTLQQGEVDAFKGLIEIAKVESSKLRRNSRFSWLEDCGGLYPRHLDRLIYLIGSDNFLLNGKKCKRHAPARRQLMRDALISSGFVSATYCQ